MHELWVVTPDDWQAWRALRLAALRDAPYAFCSTLADWEGAPEQRWRERLAAFGSYNVVALHEGAHVGMVSGMPGDLETAELIGMWVAPRARRLGVGGALIGAVEEWAQRAGKSRLRLEVKRDNHPAIELYRRRGFRGAGLAESQDEIGMHLALPRA